jgi:hypothetical protein
MNPLAVTGEMSAAAGIRGSARTRKSTIQTGDLVDDVFVCHLRKKLAQATDGKHYIETVFGVEAIGSALRRKMPTLPHP